MDDDLPSLLAALCQADDAQGVLALMSRAMLTPGHEIAHGRQPIEWAIEADAPGAFAALLDWAQAQGEPDPLRARLWGGISPVHQCAFVDDSCGMKPNREAPRCLDVALRRDPSLAWHRDEDGRSTLDWAAMSSQSTCFATLAQHALQCVESGSLSASQATALGASAALKIAATCADWREGMDRLSLLKKRLDTTWSDLVDAQGQTILGLAVQRPGFQSADLFCACMVFAGAPVDSHCLPLRAWKADNERQRPAGPAWREVFRSPGGHAPPRLPMTLQAMSERMDDEMFIQAMEHLRQSCAPGAWDGLREHPRMREAAMAMARLGALEQRKIIEPEAASAPAAPARSL